MKILAIDPGINEASYAILDSKHGLIDAGIISNTYKTKGLVEKLEKARQMCVVLREVLESLPMVDLAIIEASCASSGGMKNFNTFCRMALVSGAGLGACKAKEILFVPPPTWKRVNDKLENHELYFADEDPREVEKLEEYASAYAKGKRHNVYDAWCIAVWGLSIHNQNNQ